MNANVKIRRKNVEKHRQNKKRKEAAECAGSEREGECVQQEKVQEGDEKGGAGVFTKAPMASDVTCRRRQRRQQQQFPLPESKLMQLPLPPAPLLKFPLHRSTCPLHLS